MKEIRVGLVGFGMIGKLHTLAYRNLVLSAKEPRVTPRLVALLRSQLSTGGTQTTSSGFELVTTDPAQFYAQRPDAVDICTPNDLHFNQVKEALSAGTAVYCEKPLGLNYQEAVILAELAEQSKAITQVAYTMRYSSGIRQMKKLIEDGLIGKVLHFRAFMYHASYLDPARPMSWRLRFDRSGGGAFQDLGSHLADLVLYLLGNVGRLHAEMRTFIPQRPAAPGSLRMENVDVDDWMQCQVELSGGGMGTLEVSRLAAGTGESTGLEVYGSKGALIYSNKKPETASFYDVSQKQWRTSELVPGTPAGERPIAETWPDKKFSQGDMLNRHLAEIYDFLLNVAEGKPSNIDFRAAARAQEIVEAAYRSARRGGAWEDLPLKA
jgi:predicted dehydrogenase